MVYPNDQELSSFASSGIFVCSENQFFENGGMGGRHSTTKGNRGKPKTPKRSEEAQSPPRGKRVSTAQVERTCFYKLNIKKSLFVFEKESYS
jgi:hypothetical protein